ncbi:MAG: hypothetical protein IJX63_09970 [Lachnospiraceae bacterium]|nr:hypothetical protein [Lachnospiraceae bacterium]
MFHMEEICGTLCITEKRETKADGLRQQEVSALMQVRIVAGNLAAAEV